MRVSELGEFVGLRKPYTGDPWYGERGTAIHAATAIVDSGKELDSSTISPAIAPFLPGWEKFKRENSVEILSIEEKVEYVPYGLRGTLDRRLIARGHRVADIKTGQPDPWYRWQIALYRLLWAMQHNEPAPLGVTVYLSEDGNYKPEWWDDRKDTNRAKSIIEFASILKGE